MESKLARAGILARENAASPGSKCSFTEHIAKKIFSGKEGDSLSLVNYVSGIGTACWDAVHRHKDMSNLVHLPTQDELLKITLLISPI